MGARARRLRVGGVGGRGLRWWEGGLGGGSSAGSVERGCDVAGGEMLWGVWGGVSMSSWIVALM